MNNYLIHIMKIKGRAKFYLLFFLVAFFVLGISPIVKAQTVPVGITSVDELLRDLQLQGKISMDHSLTTRPFFTSKVLRTDSLLHLIDSTYNFSSTIYSNKKNTWVEALPVSVNFRYNSHSPFGTNHQGFMDAKGLQSYFTGGVFARWGILSVQFKPEFVTADNPNFEKGNGYGAETKPNYRRAFLGQSSIRLSAGGISVGISSENLWWGPGIQNALIMSNNAPGFNHLVINTTKPLKTPIGNFEFSLIAGKLIEDTSVLLEVKDLTTFYYAQGNYAGNPADPKLDTGDWRYLNGLHVSYTPKWIPGLYLGFNRVGYVYNTYTGNRNNIIYDYFPVFAGFFRGTSNYYTVTGSSTRIKQLISVTGRYVFKEAHAEIYAEYGSNDNTYNLRDYIMSPNHGSISTVGFKKMVPFVNNNWLDIQMEFTQLAMSVDYVVRGTGNTYEYQGSYTNQSRVIGAGIGNGSNMQTLQLTMKKGFSKQGITFQRIVHDALREPNLSNHERWIDFAIGAQYQKRLKQFLIHGHAQYVDINNYGWMSKQNRTNIYAYAGVTYFFNQRKK